MYSATQYRYEKKLAGRIWTKCKYFTILVNEKIYIFLWFWFLLLGFLTSLVFFYRILIVVSPKIRVGENLELIKHTFCVLFIAI